MILEEQGKRFELSLVGYQFPELAEDKHDANWLEVSIDVRLPEGSYRVTNPCFLTWEVGWIALWLDNIARDIPQSAEIGGIEPKLEFVHVRTEGDTAILRIRARGCMKPLWVDRTDEFTMELAVPRAAVAEAATSLQSQLQLFPPRAGAAAKPPFTLPELSPWFFIDWLLMGPGTTEDEAIANAREYMRWIDLEPVVHGCYRRAERAGRWYVRLVTDLWVPEHEPFRALFQMLSSMPMPYGAPRVARPHLRPDGSFDCRGEIDPRHEDPEDVLSLIRGHFTLTNHADERRYWWVLGRQAGE